MPDQYGFNELGTRVECIVIGCEAGGALWQWPAEKRRRHAEEHKSVRRKAANDAAAERLQHWREEHHT